MLTLERLARLRRDLRDQPVLSVYLDTDQHDPAQRGVWKTRLQNSLTEIRRGLEGRGEDPESFDAAAARVQGELPAEGFVEGKGWVAFATPDTLHASGSVPFRFPEQVSWDQGPHVAPYLRGMRQLRPVVVAVADRRHARFLTFREGVLTETAALTSYQDVGDVSESGMAKRAARSSGVRGATAKDLANRFLEVEADRLHQEVVDRIRREAGRDGLILLGGPAETVGRLAGMLDRGSQARARVVQSLSLDQTVPEMREAVGDAVSDLSRSLQADVLDEVVDQARSNGKARLGTRGTQEALRERRADLLLVSATLLEEGPELAEEMVGAAMEQSSDLELLVGDAARRLDEVGEGVAVRLRF